MTVYEALRALLYTLLNTYRYLPEDMPQRQLVDRLMEVSKQHAGNDPDSRSLHNLVSLHYLTGKRPAVYRTCELLHISRNKKSFQATLDRAIDRLLILLFGMDGVDWDGGAEDG